VLERELLTALPGAGVTPHILLARHQKTTLPVERLRWGRGLRWWVMPFVMAPAIRRCFREHHFDVLRAHSAKFLGPACLRANTGRPIIMHIQHIDRPDPIEGWALRRADRVVTISRFSRQQVIRQYGIRPDRIAVVSPGVDHAVFRPCERARGRRLLYVGGLKARKNPLGLLPILKNVEDAHLTVVGDGPLRGQFVREAKRWGLEARIALHTGVRDEERARFYHQADVFVFPSSLEGFGMPVLEAMACGLPVVCSHRGALPELVSEPWSVDPEHPEWFAAKIALLLGSPDLTREVGQRNYERSLEYSWERCAKEARAVYEQALAA
jgi:glycosyltransferase involved in cell wall biosynthesis